MSLIFPSSKPCSSRCGSGNGSRKNKLTYTCFPVKLFRLVSSDKYRSLWWDGCGSHFAVHVPRFEAEILRNEAIPLEDGFKTITFTSFIRQLNLYGFRKVVVNDKYHLDPYDLQRYAHPYFLKTRADLLLEIKRQISPHSASRTQNKKVKSVEMRSKENKAMSHHYECKGICPSRKGPKPKYVLVGETWKPMKSQKALRRRKQTFHPTVKCTSSACSKLPIKIGNESAFIAFMLPTPGMLPQSCTWRPIDLGAHTPSNYNFPQGPSMQLPVNYVSVPHPQYVPVSQNNWQVSNLATPLAMQPISNDINIASPMPPLCPIQQTNTPVIQEQLVQKSPEDATPSQIEPAMTKDKNLNKAQLIASASRSLDTGLTEDVSLTSVATQYFTIDEDFLDPWSDESEIQLNGNFFQDHVLVDCEPFLLE